MVSLVSVGLLSVIWNQVGRVVHQTPSPPQNKSGNPKSPIWAKASGYRGTIYLGSHVRAALMYFIVVDN